MTDEKAMEIVITAWIVSAIRDMNDAQRAEYISKIIAKLPHEIKLATWFNLEMNVTILDKKEE